MRSWTRSLAVGALGLLVVAIAFPFYWAVVATLRIALRMADLCLPARLRG